MGSAVGSIYGLHCDCSSDIRYIGLTLKPLQKRLEGHLSDGARTPDLTHKCKWIAKHVSLGHVINIMQLDQAPAEELAVLERWWIDGCTWVGWRLTNGSTFDWTPAAEATRRKISATKTGKPNPTKGMKRSEQARANIAAAIKRTVHLRYGKPGTMLGRKQSEETKAKISAALKGREPSAEARANMSSAQRGHPVTAETRAKLSVAHKGKILTEEHIRKVHANNRANHIRWHVSRDIVKEGCPHCLS